MRFLSIKIHGGFSSEAAAFAELLGNREARYEALVIYHEYAGDVESASRFEARSKSRLVRLDVGHRPNYDGKRGPVAKVASLMRFRASFPAILKIAREYRPDVVHSSQQLWDSSAASHVTRRLGVPQIMHANFPMGPWLRTGFSRNPAALELLTRTMGMENPMDRILSCDHVVAVSEFIRGVAIEYGVRPERVSTVRQMMRPFPPLPEAERESVRAELGVPAGAPLIGIVGRHDPHKGQEETILAFAKVAVLHENAWLVLVGDGPVRPFLQQKSVELGVAHRVLFTGQRADVPRLLGAMDIFSHPSRREAFGLATAEASASGLPVVAFAEGGAKEIVEDGVTGLLAPPGDVDALAACMDRLLTDSALARRMGAAGRERIATEFRPEDAGRKFAEVLERVTGKTLGPEHGHVDSQDMAARSC